MHVYCSKRQDLLFVVWSVPNLYLTIKMCMTKFVHRIVNCPIWPIQLLGTKKDFH
jgi:hypothetical protein